jgi:hypothetical protein
MAKVYRINVVVEYDYEIEADSLEEAQQEVDNYPDYAYNAQIYSSEIEVIDEGEDEEESE